MFEGKPRNKQTVEATTGAVTGEATFEGKQATCIWLLNNIYVVVEV